MQKTFKVVGVGLALGLAMSSILAGCSSKNETSSSPSAAPSASAAVSPAATTAPKLEPVELTWYLDNTPPADVATVEAAMNKILQEKLKVTLHLKFVDWGAYDQKMQVVNAAGENYDLAFTANWANNYYQNVSKGTFIPVDDLLQKYAPTILQTIPKIGWDAAKVNGKIYAIPNYQVWTMTNAIGFRKDLADKYGFKSENVKTLADLEPFLAQVKQNNPEMVPYEMDKAGTFGVNLVAYGFDEVAGRNIPGAIKLTDSSLKIVNQFESDEFKSYVNLMRDWNKKGYIRKDAATLADGQADRKAGKTASLSLGNMGPDDLDNPPNIGSTSYPSYVSRITQPYLLTSSIIATMTGISSTSKNPERAVMLLDLLFKDKELYNIFANGIEGKHYQKPEGYKKVDMKDSTYNPQFDWEIGNSFNSLFMSPTVADASIKMNQSAKGSPILGFTFDPNPVKAEIAQTATVTAQYIPLLTTGSADTAQFLPEFIDKLKKAGSDKIIAEEQKQIDAWKQTKGK
ncbi:DUF3502 domain-containing protein [Paenibacillus sp. LMG 31458]|uniref:DUF3502 domain-containing protein n=2 Tax=Paenibacillus TaxID=44249 RepID=A0ABX1Z4T0_9BACL|nr:MULTISPECIES: DUF3502 domain-containing protein [Paenibacillus]NOU74956.1 DUF3502 domain-containing protein [Paenibacillus phytorum]NOU88233.1 DUF3502 domain-containing protein [Paenibacillus germinis]